MTRIAVGGPGRAYGTITAKTEAVVLAPDYKFVMNPISGHLDKVVNNVSVLKINKDVTDPTGGGAAADGRIPVQFSDGTIKYLAYYDAP